MSENTAPGGGDMNVVARLIGVFTSPGDTFKAVSVKPAWLLPILFVIALTIAFTVIAKPVIEKETAAKQQEMFEKRGMDQEQIDKMMESMQGKAGMISIFKYGGIIVWTFAVFCIIALVWQYVTKFIVGADVSFSQMMGLNAYAGIIPAVGMLIKSPIVLSRDTMNVHFSLATFLSDSLKNNFLYKFLSQVELFNIWSVAVFCIGLAVIAKKDVKKVAPVVIIVYLLWFLASSGIQKLFGM